MRPTRRMRHARAAAIAAAMAAAGCTIKVTPSDTKSSDAGASQTVGDQCTAIFNELCSQAINRCGYVTFTLDGCIASNMPTCCAGSVCSQLSQSPASAVDACKLAIDAEDCNYIANSATPSACQGVPKKP